MLGRDIPQHNANMWWCVEMSQVRWNIKRIIKDDQIVCECRYNTYHRSKMTLCVELSLLKLHQIWRCSLCFVWCPNAWTIWVCCSFDRSSVVWWMGLVATFWSNKTKKSSLVHGCLPKVLAGGKMGGGLVSNGWCLWSCFQTNHQIRRVINTSGHKSQCAPASVSKRNIWSPFGVVAPLWGQAVVACAGIFNL